MRARTWEELSDATELDEIPFPSQPQPQPAIRKAVRRSGYNGPHRGRQAEGVSPTVTIRIRRDISIELIGMMSARQTYNDIITKLIDHYHRHPQEDQ